MKNSRVNWNVHFRRISQPYIVEFGTVAGDHTIHELSDLLNALQSQVDSVTTAFNNGKNDWQSKDPSSYSNWLSNWNIFIARWQPTADWTKGRVNEVKNQGSNVTSERLASAASILAHPTAIAEALTGTLDTSNQNWDLVTDEPAYQHLMNVFKPYDGDPTSLAELDRTWRASPVVPPPVYHVPQPNAPDADLGIYKESDKVFKDIQNLIPPGINPFGPPMPIWEKIAIGVGAVLGLGIVLRIATGRIL